MCYVLMYNIVISIPKPREELIVCNNECSDVPSKHCGNECDADASD